MASLRSSLALLLILLAPALPSRAADEAAPGLYDRPVLAIDVGMHTGPIIRAAADRAGLWVVTGSDDKTVRIWSAANGALVRTIRLPAGPGDVGKIRAVAISPDGVLVAAGGWTGPDAKSKAVYLFERQSGALVQRIKGLPDVIEHLAFSSDARLLAAALWSGGLRIYARDKEWAEAARDEAYRDQSYGLEFAPDGRLAASSYDGKVRLYVGDFAGAIQPAASTSLACAHPYLVSFSPDGAKLAVGCEDRVEVDLLNGRSLEPLSAPDLKIVGVGNLSKVAWSHDGMTLFAAGQYHRTNDRLLLAWGDGGFGPRRALPVSQDTIMSVIPLADDELLVASQDPQLARLLPDGTQRWVHTPLKAIFRNQAEQLSVSSEGDAIDFGFESSGNVPARFDFRTHALTLSPSADGRTTPPRQNGLPIEGWHNSRHPVLGAQPLQLDRYETSRSLAVHPMGDRFVLGAEWSLRAFSAQGKPLWRRSVPGIVWAVNISDDGRLVVAAYGDGTIRWHRMTDGAELLAFMPLPDRTNWVAWTPEGFYAATAAAQSVLRWHVNHGWDHPADSVPVENIPGSYRPELLPLVLQELETPRALGLAELAAHNREVMLRTNSQVPPGTRLYLLTVGISAYNEDYAKNLRLQYADRDARDLASAIVNTQANLYQVKRQVLLNRDANKPGILRALKTMQNGLATGDGNDLAVVHFSGHGAMVDGKLYLLPYEVDARDAVGIKSGALSIDDLRSELLELAKYGRVLVLLDACHSGATTIDGAPLAMDSTALRTGLAAANVTVLTSSTGPELSYEKPDWNHGAFTKVLLDAFDDAEADKNHNGLISTTALANYVASHVPALTNGLQHPGMEVRFDTTLFADSR